MRSPAQRLGRSRGSCDAVPQGCCALARRPRLGIRRPPRRTRLSTLVTTERNHGTPTPTALPDVCFGHKGVAAPPPRYRSSRIAIASRRCARALESRPTRAPAGRSLDARTSSQARPSTASSETASSNAKGKVQRWTVVTPPSSGAASYPADPLAVATPARRSATGRAGPSRRVLSGPRARERARGQASRGTRASASIGRSGGAGLLGV